MSQKPSLRKQVRQHSHWPNVLLLLNNSSAEVQWCVQAFTTCTLKDLCPEDKQKVAHLVKQVREHVRQHDCASPQLDQQRSIMQCIRTHHCFCGLQVVELGKENQQLKAAAATVSIRLDCVHPVPR
jgi:hypothetical protein